MDLWSLLKRGFMNYPDRVAVVVGDRRVTYREFERRVNKLVNVLYGLGLKKGDRVSVLGENSLMVLEGQYAIIKGGMVWVPLNFRNHPKEHAYYLNNAGARAVIMQSQFAEGINSIRDEIETVEHYIVDGEDYSGMERYEDLMDKASNMPLRVDIDENDPLALLHTSGTTGKSKACLHTHRNWIMMTFAVSSLLNVQPGDVALYIAPTNHGSGTLLGPHFMMGVPNILMSKLELDLVLNTIQKEKVTTIWLAPTIIYFFLAHPNLGKYDLSSLRVLPYSSAPIAVERLKEALTVFGNVLVQAYGLVECPVITSLNADDHLLGGSNEQIRRLGSAGREVIMTDVRVVNEDGNDVTVGDVGEIIVRSPLVMKEYWQDPEATEKALKGGWLYTGDMGYLDEAGYLFIADRKKDLIITGGYNVYPKEVEEAIFKHPSVLDAAVIGVPDELWGESVKAFVVLRPGMEATEEEIVRICKENLASYKKPRSVEFIDALPKNVAGKVLKTELRKKYWEGRERKVV
jgi:acyl-CoA synthetase (AMP-forming)/AMP-acid ligase II